MNQRIDLHIGELVLHGFSPHQRYAIAEAVEMELTRLLKQRQMPTTFHQAGRFPLINAGSFIIGKDTKGEVTGNKIANAVYKSFGK